MNPIIMSEPPYIHGFIKLGSRYVPATLVSQHEWQGAITVRFESGEPYITQWADFLKTKPPTPYQQSQLDKKEKEKAKRAILVEKVKEQLGPEPKPLGTIAKAIGLTAQHLVTPLLKWEEFVGIEHNEKGWFLK